MSGLTDRRYDVLADQLVARGIDPKKVGEALKAQCIETPSWGYGDSGTRFNVFKQPGAARDVHERLADAAQVHRVTGICPSVAVHIPWDKVDDYGSLTEEAASLGLRIGAVNPNVFQEDEYKMGSLTNEDASIREKALSQILECVEVMKVVDSDILSLWFADGTNYPGQGDFRRRKRYMEEGLAATCEALPEGSRMLIEYKFFEPAFYHTDIADWGMAYTFASKLGPKGQVLVDLGHHPSGSNIEHIVAFLMDEGKLGGFHFNNRKYADDDLTTGSIYPYEVFLIYNEILAAEEEGLAPNIAYMIDQSHAVKPKIQAMIQSVMHIQTAYAKALLVDRGALRTARETGDTVEGEQILQRAFNTDVTPILERVRVEMGVDPDPLAAYRRSGYQEKIAKEREGELEGHRGWA